MSRVAAGGSDPEPVLNDSTRRLPSYRLRGLSTLRLTRSGGSIAWWF